MSTPSFMQKTPKPRTVVRLYKGRTIQMWEGNVKINDVNGWAQNPRIELFRRKWHRDFGQDPSQDDVYEIMKSERQMELGKLRDDICKNDLREPLVLTWKGKLLDGNRRFFAIRYALETLPKNHPARQNLDSVNVFVLTKESSSEDEQCILVEENFAPSLKKEWPDYVKAIKIKEAHEENGVSKADIAEKFGWSGAKVNETIRILDIIDEYKQFALDEPDQEDESGGGLGLSESEVEGEVSEKYQHFNEAQKSFRGPLQQDINFKLAFFRWLHEGKFKSFPQVRVAYKAWSNPEAKSILENQDVDAGKDAKTVVDDAARAEKKRTEVSYQVRYFLDFLRGLTMDNVSELTPETLSKLKKILTELQRLSGMINKIGDGNTSD